MTMSSLQTAEILLCNQSMKSIRSTIHSEMSTKAMIQKVSKPRAPTLNQMMTQVAPTMNWTLNQTMNRRSMIAAAYLRQGVKANKNDDDLDTDASNNGNTTPQVSVEPKPHPFGSGKNDDDLDTDA